MRIRLIFGGFWRWIIGGFGFAYADDGVHFGFSAHSLRPFLWTLTRGVMYVRVVVVKSPWLFGGLLRCLFRIKKETYRL